MTSTLLIVHNIGYTISALVMFFLFIFIYRKEHSTTLNRTLLLALVAAAIFCLSHVIGVNIPDPRLSKIVLMFNLSVMFISCFVAHFVFVFIGKEKQQKPAIIIIYAITIIMVAAYIIWPDTFLLDSVPKLYFPNYYVAGRFDLFMRLVSNLLIPLYFLTHMVLAYRAGDRVARNRLRYIFFGLLFGYLFGATALPLVFVADPSIFGFVIDPVYSIFFGPIFAIPFTYAVVKYDLMDIRIIAKRAFAYSAAIIGVGIFITLLNLANNIIHEQFPGIPQWLFPMAPAIFAVSTGYFIWKKLRESDQLKYEFITVVTHKFRGPLTQIRWAAESLGTLTPEEGKTALVEIQNANFRLIEMTNLLVRVSDIDDAQYEYHPNPIHLEQTLRELLPEYTMRAEVKGVKLTYAGQSTRTVSGDEAKIKFVIQILLDNAINYTPQGGRIDVELKEDGAQSLILRVTDTGIGMSKEDSVRMFEKFWRSKDALRADVDGMGIGLFMAQKIIARHGGKMWVTSEGLGKGSTFYMKL